MKFEATPFAQNRRGMLANIDIFLPSPAEYRVGPAEEYNERQKITVEASNPIEALNLANHSYQNIDEEHLTPDGGRSLMTLDLIRLSDGEEDTWWVCCSHGWHKVNAPSDVEVVKSR